MSTVAKLVSFLDLVATVLICFHVKLGSAATAAAIETDQTRSSFHIPRTKFLVGTLS